MRICKYCHYKIYKDPDAHMDDYYPRWRLRGGKLHPASQLANWCEDDNGYTRAHSPMTNLEYMVWSYDKTL